MDDSNRPSSQDDPCERMPIFVTDTDLCCLPRQDAMHLRLHGCAAERAGLLPTSPPSPARPSPGHSSKQQKQHVFDLWSRIIPHQLNYHCRNEWSAATRAANKPFKEIWVFHPLIPSFFLLPKRNWKKSVGFYSNPATEVLAVSRFLDNF